MSNQSMPTMTAYWTTGDSPFEDRTVAQFGPLGAFDHDYDALELGDDDLETNEFPTYDDDGGLDVDALFSDLPISQPPAALESFPPPLPPTEDPDVFLASPYLALPAPSSFAPTMTTMRRSEAPTVRVRRKASGFDTLEARAGAIAVCGFLALIATLVACVLYAGAPHRVPAQASIVAAP